MSSNTPIKSSSQVPKEPSRNLSPQMCQSPLVTLENPMQSRLSVHERDFCWQELQGSSRKSSIRTQLGPVMGPGLSTLRRPSGHPNHQIPSRSSVISGFQAPTGSMSVSDKYCDKRAGPVTPRKQRKERTVYSKEQRCLLQEYFDQCKYPDLEQRVVLALLIGVTEYEIQIWFKNRRAREHQKKSQQLPGITGSGLHTRPTYINDGGVLAFTASPNSVCKRQMDASCPPQFRPSRNSHHQESNIESLIDQPLKEMCFSKINVIREHQRQHRKPGHLSSDRTGCSNIPSPPDVSTSVDSMCERPSGLSSPPLSRPLNITPNSVSPVSLCQTAAIVSPLTELSPLSNSLYMMENFSNIDQACEIYLENTTFVNPHTQSEKDIVDIWKHGQDSCAKPPSPKVNIFLPASACEDTLCERQSVLTSPLRSLSSTSPDSESIFSTWEGTSDVCSLPPPLSPSMFPDPESTLSIIQINENFLRDAMMSV